MVLTAINTCFTVMALWLGSLQVNVPEIVKVIILQWLGPLVLVKSQTLKLGNVDIKMKTIEEELETLNLDETDSGEKENATGAENNLKNCPMGFKRNIEGGESQAKTKVNSDRKQGIDRKISRQFLISNKVNALKSRINSADFGNTNIAFKNEIQPRPSTVSFGRFFTDIEKIETKTSNKSFNKDNNEDQSISENGTESCEVDNDRMNENNLSNSNHSKEDEEASLQIKELKKIAESVKLSRKYLEYMAINDYLNICDSKTKSTWKDIEIVVNRYAFLAYCLASIAFLVITMRPYLDDM